jgi:plastocyanin
MKLRALLIAAAAGLVAAACGGGGGAPTPDAAPGDSAADLVAEVAGNADAPGDSAAPQDATADLATDAAADQIPANFVAILPCPAPAAFAPATQVSTTVDNRYSPACVRVAAGGSVTIEASVAHPLEARPGGSPGNPIPQQTAPATVSFPTPGFYPFFCPEHVDQGMLGVVWVE